MCNGKKIIRCIIISTIIILFISTLSGCWESVVDKDYRVYGRFQDAYTENEFDVECNWESINPILDGLNFEEYGLYPNFIEHEWAAKSHREREAVSNKIYFNNFSQTDENVDMTTLGSVSVSYGTQRWTSAYWTAEGEKELFFSEPMIQIYLYNEKREKEYKESTGRLEPLYELGYRAVYSLDGELALEEGKWFLDEDKDEFCRHYFEIMLKVIGKSN